LEEEEGRFFFEDAEKSADAMPWRKIDLGVVSTQHRICFWECNCLSVASQERLNSMKLVSSGVCEFFP
jgi:hypothetical protein